MAIYLISDTHFHHENILYTCKRPFANVQDMNETLIENWNNNVGADDIVYHLGDFSFGGFDEVHKVVRRLNGHICLIMGNHDRAHSISWWQRCGFHRVYDKPILVEEYFLLSHEPLAWSDDSSMVFASVYGHVHNRPEFRPVTARTFNASVEMINYTPILLSDVLTAMLTEEKAGTI